MGEKHAPWNEKEGYSDFFWLAQDFIFGVTLCRVKGRVCKLFAQEVFLRSARREINASLRARRGIFALKVLHLRAANLSYRDIFYA